MPLLFYHDDFLQHDTGPHPECARRLVSVKDHLNERGLWNRCRQVEVPCAEVDEVALIHDRDYIQQVAQYADQGGGRIESDTMVSRASYRVALRAVGAACEATRRVLEGEDRTALCLVRPPGHHARKAAPMGFCLFDSIAVAGQLAIQHGELDRVLIVDWDVHHGNGTQDAFWRSEQVGFYSVHRWPFYPGTGDRDETGAGRGLGTTCNLPLPATVTRSDYLRQVTHSLTQFADRIRPELILVSAGFDSHRLDPVGSLGLEDEDFAELTRLVQAIADVHAGGRVVSVLEGGYNIQQLPLSLEQHLLSLMGDYQNKSTPTKPP